MLEILSWLFFIVFIAALLVVGGLLLRGYLTTGSATDGLKGAFFAPKPEKRLEVVDQANVDGRRRLLLIRRDNIEHLIMTGGPVDVVIETNIGEQAARPPADKIDGAQAVYTREPKTIGRSAANS
ncbi:MAG: hypothetical protein RLZ98_3606 [Pseudomonadota bacterium]|jgi:hypothetical protein